MALFKKFYDVNPKDKLGSGTYGHVYLGTRRADNLKVAVKKMLRKNMDATILDMVIGEVQILKELNHPHIVKIYDLYKDYEAYYICLELVTGGELFTRITQKTFYSEMDARNCCKTILSAIKHCHSKHIVHRDLKPENLLMQSETDDASLKLIDFGFAQYAPEPTLKGVCGTAIYMAPEIWQNQPYGKSVDMWAFGVITYILLGGYPPFSEETRQHLINQICTSALEFHYDYWKDVSEEAKDFIRRLLTVDVNNRMTVNDALKHPWLAVSTEELKEHDLGRGLNQLKKFNARRKIKAVIKMAVAMKRWENMFKRRRSSDADDVVSPTTSQDENNSSSSAAAAQDGHDHVRFQEPEGEAGEHARSAKLAKSGKASSHHIHRADSAADVARVERQFETLCSQYSTCYTEDDDDDDDDDAAESGETASPIKAAAATGNLPPPPGTSAKRGMSMLQRNQSLTVGGPAAESAAAGTVMDAIRNLEKTNTQLEEAVAMLQETIKVHTKSISNNKDIIASLRRITEAPK